MVGQMAGNNFTLSPNDDQEGNISNVYATPIAQISQENTGGNGFDS